VAAETRLKEPLHLIFVSTTATALMFHPRIVIRVNPHASVAVVEHYMHVSEAEPFTNVVTSVELAAGACLEHCRVQEEALGAMHVASLHADVGRDARFVSHNFALGGAVARLGLTVDLKAAGAEAVLNGLQFAHGTQQLDTHTQVDHVVPNTRSTEDYRGIADGRGRVVFNGKVFVHANAMKTDAQQSSRNLLLSPTAEIDTKPELEIYADDVKCAHGATVGQLDQAALFYLRTRGLGHEEARAVLTLAFADAVVSRVSWPALRKHLSDAVHRRFKPGNLA
jgi:Fe-S cluster assembly protein SufD